LWTLFYIHVQVQLVIPNSPLENALQCFQGITPTQDQYYLIELPVHAFTEQEFIKTFIKNGNTWHCACNFIIILLVFCIWLFNSIHEWRPFNTQCHIPRNFSIYCSICGTCTCSNVTIQEWEFFKFSFENLRNE